MAKPNKNAMPAPNAGKNKKQREQMTREERRAKAKGKKTEKEEIKRDRSAGLQSVPGLTYHQFENSSSHREPAATNLEKDFLEALAGSLDRRFGISVAATPSEQLPPPDEPAEQEAEDLSTTALRGVVANEISRLLAATQPLFDGLRDSPELAEAIAIILFEEGGPMASRLAEVLIADQPAEAVASLLEEVSSKVYELQLVAGSLRPDYELDQSARLELIEPDEAAQLKAAAEKETARLSLRHRLSEIMAGGGMIDATVAGLINEGEREAATERQRRAQFRKKLAHGLRERKQKEGRRFSGSPVESGDEEFIRFLMENRGDLQAVRHNLPIHLREQVTNLLRDEERKAPILRRIAAIKAIAQRRWAAIQIRLQAGADRPEETVASTLRAIRVLRDELAQIRELGIELNKLDDPDKPTPVADYGAATSYRTWSDRGGLQPTWTLAQADGIA